MRRKENNKYYQHQDYPDQTHDDIVLDQQKRCMDVCDRWVKDESLVMFEDSKIE